MAYELRVAGVAKGSFPTEEGAIEAAREVIQENADAEVEVIDLATGRACAPGASKNWREELSKRVGF